MATRANGGGARRHVEGPATGVVDVGPSGAGPPGVGDVRGASRSARPSGPTLRRWLRRAAVIGLPIAIVLTVAFLAHQRRSATAGPSQPPHIRIEAADSFDSVTHVFDPWGHLGPVPATFRIETAIEAEFEKIAQSSTHWDMSLAKAFPASEYLGSGGQSGTGNATVNGEGLVVVASPCLVGYLGGEIETVLFVAVHWAGEERTWAGWYRIRSPRGTKFDASIEVERSSVTRFIDRIFSSATIDGITVRLTFRDGPAATIPWWWADRYAAPRWRLEDPFPTTGPASRVDGRPRGER